MASMVVMACPTAAPTGITHDRLGMPSRCTVQAPQSATPQPNLVPFMPSRSRKTHSKGMSGDASTLCDLPLIFRVTMAWLNASTGPGSASSWVQVQVLQGAEASAVAEKSSVRVDIDSWVVEMLVLTPVASDPLPDIRRAIPKP